MNYVDGFVAAVPTANRDKYRKHAEEAAVVFKEHGALQIIECWGNDDNATVSDAPPTNVRSLSPGTYHGCGVKRNDKIKCWGNDSYAYLSEVPTGAHFRSAGGGYEHSCALKRNGKVKCWGSDDVGQVSDTPGARFRQVDAAVYG